MWALVSGRTPHERRLCRLAEQCAEHVRVELRCSRSGWWPGGFVEAVRVKRHVVERAASDWTRQYATEREGELSVMHNVGLIRLALGRFGIELHGDLLRTLETLSARKWLPSLAARSGVVARAKEQQYELLRSKLDSVLDWIAQCTVEELLAAQALVRSGGVAHGVASSVVLESEVLCRKAAEDVTVLLKQAHAFLLLMSRTGARAASVARLRACDLRVVDEGDNNKSTGSSSTGSSSTGSSSTGSSSMFRDPVLYGSALWLRYERKAGSAAGQERAHYVLLVPHVDRARCAVLSLARYWEAVNDATFAGETASARHGLSVVGEDGEPLNSARAGEPLKIAALAARGSVLVFSFGTRRKFGGAEQSFSATVVRRALAVATVASFAVGAPELFTGARRLHALRAYACNELLTRGLPESSVQEYVGWAGRERTVMGRSYAVAKWRAIGSPAARMLAGHGSIAGQLRPLPALWAQWSQVPREMPYLSALVWLLTRESQLLGEQEQEVAPRPRPDLAPRCPTGRHALTFHAQPLEGTVTRCDECRTTLRGAAYSCAPCDHDLCAFCYRAAACASSSSSTYRSSQQSAPRCPIGQHALLLQSATQYDDDTVLSCDKCGTALHGPAYSCEPCDYDLCAICYRAAASS